MTFDIWHFERHSILHHKKPNKALGRIEGDPLSGICFVGQYDTQSLQIFLLWPQLGKLPAFFIYLVTTLNSVFVRWIYVSRRGLSVNVSDSSGGQEE